MHSKEYEEARKEFWNCICVGAVKVYAQINLQIS